MNKQELDAILSHTEFLRRGGSFYQGVAKNIELILAEIDRLQAELDTAVFQLSGDCESCEYLKDCHKHDTEGWLKDCPEWQWRGLEGQK